MKNNIIESKVFEHGKLYEFSPKRFEEDMGKPPILHKIIGFQNRFMFKGSEDDCTVLILKLPLVFEGDISWKFTYNYGFFIHREWCKEVR